MADDSVTFDASASIIFIGNSYTFGRVDPVMHYNSANVRDLTAPSNGGTFTDTTGTNPYEPHPWGGVPGVFKQFSVEAGLSYDVAISARNAASLEGHYLNSSAAHWDLRGNLASQAWDTVVLQDNSTQALPSGAGSITFAAGSSTATLTIKPIADTTQETDETLGITLAASPASYRVGTSATVTGTILNDDPTGPTVNPALPTVTLTANPSASPEDSGTPLVYTFTRSGATDTALTINFTAFRDGATSPSVATSGTNQDFVATNGSVYTFQSGSTSTTGSVSFTSNTGSIVIPAGQTSATITLTPKADTTVESDESMRFTLSSNSNYNVGTQGAVAATIVNDDFAAGTDTSLPNITLSLATPAVYEDAGGNLVYTFTRSGSNTDALTVNFGVKGTATLPGKDFTVTGADTFKTAGAANPDLTSFQTYATKLAQYAITGSADAANNVPANVHANAATDVYLYETWARPNLVTGALVVSTDPTTGAITNTSTSAAEYYTSIEGMTADLRAAYEGLAASNPIFKGVAPVGAAFLAAVQDGTAIRNPYSTTPGTTVGNIDLWWDDNLHASKYGSYLSGLTLFATITGVDPRSLGASDKVASDLGIDSSVAVALQAVAAATVNAVPGAHTSFPLQAHWTAPGQVTELQGGTAGLLASAGAFTFSDADTTHVHSVGVTAVTQGALGTLNATLHTDTTGDGSGGAVNWTYTVDDKAVEYLQAGEKRVEQFLVTLTDQNGGTSQHQIAVTINGTNDAPTVSGAVTGAASEGGAKVTLDALQNASDVDHDTVLSVVNVPTNLPPGVTYDAASHSFTLDPSNAAFQAQPAGQKGVVTISYGVSDGVADPVVASTTFNVTLDHTPPAVASIATATASPSNATSLTETVMFSEVVSGVDASDFTVRDAAGNAVSGASVGTPVSRDGGATYAVTVSGLTGDGTVHLDLNTSGTGIADLAGNAITGGATGVGTTLDHTAPRLGADAASGTGVTAALTGHLLANDSDASALHVVSIQYASDRPQPVPAVGGAQVASTTGTLTVAADGSFSFHATEPGRAVFTETVADAAGNVSQTTLTLDVAKAAIPAALSFNFALTDATFDFRHNHDVMTAPDGTVTDLTGVAAITFTDGTVQERDGSPLVDDLYYDAHNLDVWRAHIDPDQHYAQSGWHEGRDPNAYFSTSGYLATNSDVAAARVNPLTHYDQYGWHEGRSPGASFSAEAYLAANPDVAAARVDPLAHYLESGQAEGRPVLPGLTVAKGSGDHLYGAFDASYYLAHNPDVAAAAQSQSGTADSFAFTHYLTYGAHEGRDPNAYFSTSGYLAANPDVAAARVNPLTHYDQYGWHEGRDPAASFHTEAYLAANPDVAAAGVDPLAHYLQFGIAEGRHLA